MGRKQLRSGGNFSVLRGWGDDIVIVGDYGTAISGNGGTAIAGVKGTAIVEDGGSAVAGARGVAIVNGSQGVTKVGVMGTIIFRPLHPASHVVCQIGIDRDSEGVVLSEGQKYDYADGKLRPVRYGWFSRKEAVRRGMSVYTSPQNGSGIAVTQVTQGIEPPTDSDDYEFRGRVLSYVSRSLL